MFQGKGMFWGHLGQHPFFVLLVVDQFSGQLMMREKKVVKKDCSGEERPCWGELNECSGSWGSGMFRGS